MFITIYNIFEHLLKEKENLNPFVFVRIIRNLIFPSERACSRFDFRIKNLNFPAIFQEKLIQFLQDFDKLAY